MNRRSGPSQRSSWRISPHFSLRTGKKPLNLA
jgi:hypothetical protein